VHQASPHPEGGSIHRDDVERSGNEVEPMLNLSSLRFVLVARDLNACLDFSNRHCRNVQVGMPLTETPWGRACEPAYGRGSTSQFVPGPKGEAP
jgi:hypothetical protein